MSERDPRPSPLGEVSARSGDGGVGVATHTPPALRATSPKGEGLGVRGEFPAIAGWHYLDSAATAQKPQAVIDAITRAYARDYATVHRGVYERSASMTDAYERSRAASQIASGSFALSHRSMTKPSSNSARALAGSSPRLSA